jgi:hypothetical protein
MAVLLAAERQVPKDETIMVTDTDIDIAASYIQRWGVFSVETILNAGKKLGERLLDKIMLLIKENPGVLRSTIMQHRHLTKREADEVLGTLEDRQLVRREANGRASRYYIS